MKRLETVAFVALILTGVVAVSLAQSDDVRIVGLAPAEGVTRGVETEFTVEVDVGPAVSRRSHRSNWLQRDVTPAVSDIRQPRSPTRKKSADVYSEGCASRLGRPRRLRRYGQHRSPNGHETVSAHGFRHEGHSIKPITAPLVEEDPTVSDLFVDSWGAGTPVVLVRRRRCVPQGAKPW